MKNGLDWSDRPDGRREATAPHESDGPDVDDLRCVSEDRYRDRVRWDALFADLEAAVEEADRREYEAEVAEQARAEYAAVCLHDRLRAHVGRPVVCQLVDGQRLEGDVVDVGPQWLLVRVGHGQVLLPSTALAGVEGLTASVLLPEGEVGRRIGLGVVLRGLAVRRVPVGLALHGGGLVTGTVDRVGADHLELAVHNADVPRRSAAVVAIRLVPFAALMTVRLAGI